MLRWLFKEDLSPVHFVVLGAGVLLRAVPVLLVDELPGLELIVLSVVARIACFQFVVQLRVQGLVRIFAKLDHVFYFVLNRGL